MNPIDSEHTQRIADSPATDEGKDASLVPTHQLTPIAGSNGYQQQISFDESQPLELSITNINGSIKVKTSNEKTIWLVVRRKDHQDEEPLNLTVSVEGNKISVHPDWQLSSSLAGLARKIKDQLKTGLEPGDWNLSKLRIGNDFDFDIRVEVPRTLLPGSKVALRTTSGAIDIEGVPGDVTSASASGSISARDLDGIVSLHTASGSVRAENIQNSLEANTASGSIKINGGEAWTALRTVSGSIQVDDFTMRNAKLASVSGSMKLNVITNNALAPYGFDTVSGSINLNVTLPGDSTGPSLQFRSVSGSGNAKGEWASSGKRSWVVGQGGGAPFKVSSVSGSLNTTASVDPGISTRNELLPASDRYDNDQPTEPVTKPGPHADFDVDINRDDINRAVNWAREAARRFTQPLDDHPDLPTAPVPPAPPSSPASASPATPPAPPSPMPAASAPHQVADDFVATPLVNEPVVSEPVADRLPFDPQVAAPVFQEAPEDEEALKVLEALERGDIDVEEALARIERAENPTP
ncbi:MAG: DUF4097 family beta strand repeat-containing protein [Thermomicrobiales bacterium]